MTREKPFHTRRYQETERKLLRGAYKISNPARKKFITVRELARQARVGTSTFYRHFRNLLDFSHRHEKILMKEAEQLLIDLSQKGLSKEVIFFKVSRMIYLNRASIRLLLANNNDWAMRRTFWILRPIMAREWPTYGRACDQKIYSFFVAEAVEVVRIWGTDHSFRQNYLEEVARELSFIAKRVAPVLAPMVKAEEERRAKMPKNHA